MGPLLVFRCAQTTAAVVLAGALVLRLLAWGSGARGAARGERLVWLCGGVLVIAGVGVLGLTAAAMTGQTWAEACRDGAIRTVLTSTHFGAVWLVRGGLLAGLFAGEAANVCVRRDGPARVPFLLDAANLLLAAAALTSLVWSGHAQASARSAWLLPAAVLHAVAAGAWPGGLLPLALLLARARRDPALLSATAAITRRFSRLCVAAVAILACTGLLNSLGMAGTFAALWPGTLWSGGYGRLLTCKVALFLGMLGLGAANHRRVRQDVGGSAVETVRRLGRDVGWECALAVGVLAATEALAMSAPPR